MRYMDIGDKNADKVIVLLHGKNFSGYYWERIANDLLKRKYRVVIPDQIGLVNLQNQMLISIVSAN